MKSEVEEVAVVLLPHPLLKGLLDLQEGVVRVVQR